MFNEREDDSSLLISMSAGIFSRHLVRESKPPILTLQILIFSFFRFALNFKILRFFLIPAVLVSTTLFNNIQDVRAGLQIQWQQDEGFKRSALLSDGLKKK